MNFSDIMQLVLICAMIFLVLGYALQRRFPNGLQTVRNLLLPPRYLKSAGVWVRKNSSSATKRKNTHE